MEDIFDFDVKGKVIRPRAKAGAKVITAMATVGAKVTTTKQPQQPAQRQLQQRVVSPQEP